MLSAILNALIGTVLTFIIGRLYLLEPASILVKCIFISNIVGFIDLMFITTVERHPRIRKVLLGRPLKTWPIFLTLYFLPLWLFCQPLQTLRGFFALIIPLIQTTGFAIVIFGPIQDRIIQKINLRKSA